MHSLGLDKNVTNQDDYEREIIRFYSMKMLILHCQLLKDDKDSIERIMNMFNETHKYESLQKYIDRKKTEEVLELKMNLKKAIRRAEKKLKELNTTDAEIDEEKDSKKVQMLKKQLKDLSFDLGKANISRSVVLTNSQTKKTRFDEKGEINIGINEIDQNGTTKLEEALINFLGSPKSKLFVIEINDSSKANLVEYLKNVIDNTIESFYSKYDNLKKKLVDKEILIIFFKPLQFSVTKDSNIFDLEYFKNSWNYQVIDDLQDSCYQENLNLMCESSQEIFRRMRTGKCMDLLTKMFMESIKDMEVRASFEVYLKDLILPTLQNQIKLLKERDARSDSNESQRLNLSDMMVQISRLDDSPNKIQNSRLKIVKLLGMKVFEDIQTKNMVDWKAHMFTDKFTFENICSIQECVASICRNEFKKKLKFIMKYLVEFQGISGMLTIQNYPQDCKEILEQIFIENLNEFMKIDK